MDEFRRSMNDPQELQETLEMMKDPKVQAEVGMKEGERD